VKIGPLEGGIRVRRSKKLVLTIAAISCSLILAVIPMVGQVSPAQAVNPPWTKYAGEVTLEVTPDNNEKYVMDAWVVRDGNTYRMWYTHIKTDLGITELVDSLVTSGFGDIIDDIGNMNPDDLVDHLAALDIDEIVDILDGTSTVIGYATSTNGVAWTVASSEALSGDSSALWDSVGTPCVIKDGDTYKMWYTRLKTDLTQADLEGILDDLDNASTVEEEADAIVTLLDSTRTVIGYAESDDNGESWRVQDNEVLPAGSDNAVDSVGDPCVILTDGAYEMWYTHGQTDLDQDDLVNTLDNFNIDAVMDILDVSATVIGYATSPDGVDWVVQEPEALPGSTGFWDSVANPSVLKTGGTYEMWYTNIITDLEEADIQSILDEVAGLDVPGLIDTFDPEDLDPFLEALSALDIDELKDLLSDTRTVVGYATSANGADWVEQDPESLKGSSNSLWSSIGAPSVIQYGRTYKMWYTKGISNLTLDDILSLLQAEDLTLGYAYYTPSPGGGTGGGVCGGGGGGGLVLEVIVDFESSYYSIDQDGRVKRIVDITSEDGALNLVTQKGTFVLDEEGEPLARLEFMVDETPPLPPPEANMVGLPYNFEPDGATFNPPITVTWSYDQSDVPLEVAEEDLVVAYYNEYAGEWVVSLSEVDTINNTITASVSHFTTFAIIAYAGIPPSPPVPAAFMTSSLSVSPSEVNIGKPVTISVLVRNIGEEAGGYAVDLSINGVVEATEAITLAGGASQAVTFTINKYEAGTYSVEVNGITSSFIVKAAPPLPEPTPQPTPEPPPESGWNWWLIGIIAAVAIAIPLVLRWRREGNS